MIKKTINILFPVLNEEKRIEEGLYKTIAYMEQHFPGQYEINILDNGSTDKTEEIAAKICNEQKRIFYHKCSGKGVGLAFREGVANNQADIVGYMDIDLSTDLQHINEVMYFFQNEQVDVVNGSRLAKGSNTTGRKWYRNVTSWGLTFLLKLSFGLKASDSICGFKFFDKKAVDWLVQRASGDDGWFYIIELLLRAEKSGMKMRELPVNWKDDWNSNLKTGKLIKYYLIQIHALRKRLRKGNKRGLEEKYS